jgi:hypothetical protein
MERRKCLIITLKNELWNFMVDMHSHCTHFNIDGSINVSVVNMTFCGPARQTVLINRQTENLNFDTNYITRYFNELVKKEITQLNW